MTAEQIGPVAVLYDTEDARRFLAENPAVSRVLTLTPDARATLLQAKIDLPIRDGCITTGTERRVMAHARVASRELAQALRNRADALAPLGIAGAVALRHDIHWQAALFARLWHLPGNTGPWLVAGHRTFEQADSRVEAHELLLRRIRRTYGDYLHARGVNPAPARILLNLFARMAVRLQSGENVFVTHGFGYGMPALDRCARDTLDAHFLALRGASGSIADIVPALRSLWDAMRGEPTMVVVPAGRSIAAENAARRALSVIADPVIRRGLDVFGDLLAREAALASALVRPMKDLLRVLRPAACIAYSMRWAEDAALAAAAGEAGTTRVLVSHGSHTPLRGAVGNFVETELASGILVSPLADRTVLQSPLAAKVAAGQPYPLATMRSRPVMWAHRVMPIRARSTVRRILHAGTFKQMRMPRPWLYETPDEYVNGLAALIRAVARLDNTELVLRLRDLPECSIASLNMLLPRAPNCRLRTGGSFLDDLAEADVMVSYSSTTIEEAIHAGRPVLLWGGSDRYQHLPASSIPPTADNRAAAYRVTDPDRLAPMLDAILAAHAGRPLSDAERAEYVWPAGTPDRLDLLRMLCTANAPVSTVVAHDNAQAGG